MKSLVWIGSSKKDLLTMPQTIRQEFGFALHLAQVGDNTTTPSHSKASAAPGFWRWWKTTAAAPTALFTP